MDFFAHHVRIFCLDLSGVDGTVTSIYNTFLSKRDASTTLRKLASFFVDFSQQLASRGDRNLSLRVLSNLAEMELDDPQPLRVMAYKLEADAFQANESFLPAIAQLRRILQLRPEEPQSHRDLSLALSREATRLMRKIRATQLEMASSGEITEYSLEEEERLQNEAENLLKESIELMLKVATGKWDTRFDQIQVTALTELNRLLVFARAFGFDHLAHSVDKRLLAACDVDLRVVAQWDTDMTDIELHVTEPSGERCSSWNNRTRSGGILSRDFTKGYGPEEYMVKTALKGKYQVMIRMFQSLERIGGTTVVVRVYTNFGRPGLEKEYVSTLRVSKPKETVQVATIEFGI